MDAEEQKRAVGRAAAELVASGMTVGLGSGSTAAWFVRALAERKLDIRGVPTSEATADLARSLGLTVLDLDFVGQIDLTIDGADEIGPGLSLIKGGGAALLREKLVWEASRRCVVIADASKVVARSGDSPCRSRWSPSATRHRRPALRRLRRVRPRRRARACALRTARRCEPTPAT